MFSNVKLCLSRLIHCRQEQPPVIICRVILEPSTAGFIARAIPFCGYSASEEERARRIIIIDDDKLNAAVAAACLFLQVRRHDSRFHLLGISAPTSASPQYVAFLA